MSTHLRYANASDAIQRAALVAIVEGCAPLMTTFVQARELNLPDWWIVSGAIYNHVWNHLTAKPELYGVKDVDLFYFDSDTSYEAEDAVIRRAASHFAGPVAVEVRNQARVHLWYEAHFGQAYEPLEQATDGIDNFVCRTHAVGMRLCADDCFEVYAPFGLGDLFGFRLTPHAKRDNRVTYEEKASRQRELWPELTVFPWPDG